MKKPNRIMLDTKMTSLASKESESEVFCLKKKKSKKKKNKNLQRNKLDFIIELHLTSRAELIFLSQTYSKRVKSESFSFSTSLFSSYYFDVPPSPAHGLKKIFYWDKISQHNCRFWLSHHTRDWLCLSFYCCRLFSHLTDVYIWPWLYIRELEHMQASIRN